MGKGLFTKWDENGENFACFMVTLAMHLFFSIWAVSCGIELPPEQKGIFEGKGACPMDGDPSGVAVDDTSLAVRVSSPGWGS